MADRKYDVWFCRCGTIQLMPKEYYKWLEEDYVNRSILRVCQCCGTVRRVWLSEYENGFCVNSTSEEDFELSPEEQSNVRVIFSKGIRVPLKGGLYATRFSPAVVWFDETGKGSVDTNRLIREVEDEDKLSSIAAYAAGIDWRGTPYDQY